MSEKEGKTGDKPTALTKITEKEHDFKVLVEKKHILRPRLVILS